MSSQPDEAVQPSAAVERIPLAPLPPAPANDGPFLAGLALLDGVLVLIVAAFAFLVACTALGNSDLFLHLAAGRLIAQGQFPFTDPFTFTADAWVNQSWLFDLLLYHFYNATGPTGEALSILKALGFTAVALLLIRAGSKPGERLWIPATCALVAVLAMSPRSLLNPVLASMVVLAALVAIMARHRPGSRALLAAPALCLLWANLDAWFFLGPLLMVLFAVGRFLDLQATPDDKKAEAQVDAKQASLAAVACLAACLANPYLWNVFTAPPPELARYGAGAELASSPDGDPQFRGWQLSVWDRAYYYRTTGLSPAGLTFFPFALLSLVSFVVALPEIRWWRVLAWLATLALALLSVRAILFFAIVAGPVMALNFLDASERLLGPQAYRREGWRAWARSGRVLTAFLALCLCVLTVPGWLQAQPNHRYRVALGLDIDEGLRAAALKADEWRKQGARTAGQRWFNLSPEVANYFAWFCPGERTFLDQRFAMFRTDTAKEFRAVRRSLQGQEAPGSGEDGLSKMAWREVFAANDLRWMVCHFQSLESNLPTLSRLYSNPDEWTPCFAAGKTTVFAWRGPSAAKKTPLDPRLPANFAVEAFGPGAVPAPAARSPLPPKPWYAALLESEAPAAPSVGYAQQQLVRFESLAGRYAEANDRVLASMLAASLVGRAALGSDALGLAYNARVLRPIQAWPMQGPQRRPLSKPAIEDAFFEQAVRPSMRSRFDAGPPSALYLALRAAREAIDKNPLDGGGQFLLAELYGRLGQRTREGTLANDRLLPHLRALRQTQMVAPLQAVLRLSTDRQQRLRAHMLLATAFSPNEYLDLHVLHLGEFVRLCRETGSVPGVAARNLPQAAEGLEKELAAKQKRLASVRGQFEKRPAGKPAVQNAAIALRLGLAGEAMSLLEKMKPEDMGMAGPEAGGLQVLVFLQLATGRLEDARALLGAGEGGTAPDPRLFGMHPLGMPAYGWFVAQLCAGSGDYAQADEELGKLAGVVAADPALGAALVQLDVVPGTGPLAESSDNLARFAGLMVGEVLLRGAREVTRRPGDQRALMPFATHPPHRNLRLPWQALLGQAIQNVGGVVQLQADLLAVRAALALEQGNAAQARKLAEQSLELGGGPASPFRSAPYAALVLELVASGQGAIAP